MKKALHLNRTLRAALVVLLLNVVGMGKGYAQNYDFSAVCETGQTLYYKFLEGYEVALTRPNGGWNGYTMPSGNLILPGTVYYNGTAYSVTSIDGATFANCVDLTGPIQIPNTVTTIGLEAFLNCQGISSFSIPESVVSISVSAFRNTGWYNDLPDGLIYLDNCCLGYKGEKPTGDLTILNGTRLLASGAFDYCKLGTLRLPNSLRVIGQSFQRCEFTGELVIPEGVVSIGEAAFLGCMGFTGPLVIPNSVISIGDYAFGYEAYFNFTSLSLGNSIQRIGAHAFSACPEFESITVYAENPPICDNSFPSNAYPIPVYVPCESYIAYESISWGGYSDFGAIGECGFTIEAVSATEEYGSVEGGGTYDLRDTCTVKAVPNIGYVFVNWTEDGMQVSQDAEYSFVVRKNRNLVAHFVRRTVDGFDFSDVCPSGQTLYYRIRWEEDNEVEVVAPLNDYTLWLGYQKPTGDVVVPEQAKGFNVTAIGSVRGDSEGGFAECQGVTSVSLPNSIKTIGEHAFAQSGITSIVIPNSVTAIGKGAFQGCGSLTSILLPNSIETINESVFASCYKLLSITIPNSVQAIEKHAFSGCYGLTTIDWGESVKYIGIGAFNGCYGLAMLTIPNTVEYVERESFYGCTGLTTVIISESVKSVGSKAFANCQRLNMVYYNVKEGLSASSDVFKDSPNLTTIHIGPSVKEIGASIFKNCTGVHLVVAMGPTPATLVGNAFADFADNSILQVSCNKRMTYYAVWNMFSFDHIIEDCSEYPVSMDNTGSGGSVTTSTPNAQMGEVVTLTVTPNPGMHLASLTVCNATDPTQVVPVTPVGGKASSAFSFTMPPFGVVVTAAFATGTSVGEINSSIPAAVYPNPTTGNVKVEASDLRHVSIFNALGQQVYDSQADGDAFECDLSCHEPGVYLIRLETANGIATKRVVLTK